MATPNKGAKVSDTAPIFDLENAIVVLQAATKEARRLDAVTVPTTDEKGIKRGDPAVSAALRDIQHLMHLCEYAHQEVAKVYWASRDFQDPLD